MRTLNVLLAALALSELCLAPTSAFAAQYLPPSADSEEEFLARGRSPVFIRGEYVPVIYAAFADFEEVLKSFTDACSNRIEDYLISLEVIEGGLIAIAFVPHHGRASKCWDRFGIGATYFVDKGTGKIVERILQE